MASISSLQEKLEDLVKCPICLDSFTNPRYLPCHHSLCLGCLEEVLGTRSQMECPLCKQEIQVTNGVSDFPADFTANSVLQVISEYQKIKAAQGNGAVAREPTRQEQIGNVPSNQTDLEAAATALDHDENPPCPVCCQGVPTDPHCLNCGHLVCWTCVEFLLPVGGSGVNCPTCDCHTLIVQEENHSGFPDDDTLLLQVISMLDLGMDLTELLRSLVTVPNEVPMAVPEAPSCSLCQDNVSTSPEHLNCGHVLCAGCTGFLKPILGPTLHCPTCQMET